METVAGNLFADVPHAQRAGAVVGAPHVER